MNVLVMNLTRLGDLLQSQPAIAGLAAKGHVIRLCCLENFAPAAELMQGIEQVLPFPGARILARLDKDWRQALATHQEALAALENAGGAPDIVINLTPSEPARLLTRALATRGRGQAAGSEVRGFVLDEFGFNADTSAWAAFLQLAARSRGASPFNIVDIFRRIAGLRGAPGQEGAFALRGPTDEQKAAARARILAACPQAFQTGGGERAGEFKGFVALQLGASEERRRWPVARFAEVAARLSREGYLPVLVGTAAEKPLGLRLQALAGAPVADLMGATDLRELAGVLACCQLLVTNDTGTMHLAAGLGVRCVAIFLATAQPWDTGPYLPGCLCLEPDLSGASGDCHPCGFGRACPHMADGKEPCRQAIDAAGVSELALAMLWGRDPSVQPGLGARVWQTRIGEDGLMDLASLSGHENSDRTRLVRAQRRLYRRYLDGEELAPASGEPPLPLSPRAALELGKTLGEAADLLFLLLRQGELLGREAAPAVKAKFLATWQRVQGVLGAQERLGVLAALWLYQSERPGLDLPGILALAERFRALVLALRETTELGTQHA